jgi:hypothetical protein
LTNLTLSDGSGTETLTRDLALALRRRGHSVVCFAPSIGRIAAEIRATGTAVVRSLLDVSESPDIIHGHHSGPTMMAIARFPNAQALFVCHDWSSVYDDPPRHPRLRRYLYVRHVLRDRLVSERGIAPHLVAFWGNTVDLARAAEPRPAPQRLMTAGAYCHPGSISFLSEIARHCAALGILFLGELIDSPALMTAPENALANCDLVFASGRMAIEAIMAGSGLRSDHRRIDLALVAPHHRYLPGRLCVVVAAALSQGRHRGRRARRRGSAMPTRCMRR